MFDSVTLEISLKPFRQTDNEYITKIVDQVFEQWTLLFRNRKTISLMLWTADGSEILDYTGNLDDEFEWCIYLGTANNPEATEDDPLELSLHWKKRKYMENPPKMTYRILKNIVSIIKAEGKKYFPDAVVRVGETFDIGPEFAVSDFKYRRHLEIITGTGCNDGKNFINSYGILSADDYHYAAYPNGVPEGTPFGTFLGAQTKALFDDIGFDFLWLSNGVGFSANSWKSSGCVFDGKEFHTSELAETKDKVLSFWTLFREQCSYPIETRGTNFSAGIDYASNAVCLYDIYNTTDNVMPPPNSPWAAIDGNFGLEIMGHMTRICEVPNDRFMFRYYLHDPWWVNSPWYDRYEGKPHDIYMPMAISAVNKEGKVKTAAAFNILSIDNTYGEMPDNCVYEPLPHILKAEKDEPDDIGSFVWVYPFREYTTAKDEQSLREMMSGDWFVCQLINNGFPLSCVVSRDNFMVQNLDIYKKSILLTPVPTSGSEFENVILDYAEKGGKVIFLGTVERASDRFMKLFGLNKVEGVTGDIKIDRKYIPDTYKDEVYPDKISIKELICAGKLDTADENGELKLYAEYKNTLWYRAPVGGSENPNGGHLIPDDQTEYVRGEVLFRKLIEKYGYSIGYVKSNANAKAPVFAVHRSDNCEIYSVYNPNTAAEAQLRHPLGAPILLGYEAELKDGKACYRFPRAEHTECRVYVEQESGVVGARENPPGSYKYRRKIEVNGLKNATVRFFGEAYCKDYVHCTTKRGPAAHAGYHIEGETVHSEEYGTYYEVKNVSGDIIFELPEDQFMKIPPHKLYE